MSVDSGSVRFSDLSVRDFLDQLASGSPVPGGGAGAALSGAAGAALIAMVCNLTIGREKFHAVEASMVDAAARLDTLRCQLLDLLETDALAYPGVIAAYRLPKVTVEEKASRSAAIQRALKSACDAPLGIARACVAVLNEAPNIARDGNPSAVSDAGVGAELARAGFESAALNVTINLATIRDAAFVVEQSAELERMRAIADRLRDETSQLVAASIRR